MHHGSEDPAHLRANSLAPGLLDPDLGRFLAGELEPGSVTLHASRPVPVSIRRKKPSIDGITRALVQSPLTGTFLSSFVLGAAKILTKVMP